MKNVPKYWIVINTQEQTANIFTTIAGVQDYTKESIYRITHNKSIKYKYYQSEITKNRQRIRNARPENFYKRND